MQIPSETPRFGGGTNSGPSDYVARRPGEVARPSPGDTKPKDPRIAAIAQLSNDVEDLKEAQTDVYNAMAHVTSVRGSLESARNSLRSRRALLEQVQHRIDALLKFKDNPSQREKRYGKLLATVAKDEFTEVREEREAHMGQIVLVFHHVNDKRALLHVFDDMAALADHPFELGSPWAPRSLHDLDANTELDMTLSLRIEGSRKRTIETEPSE